MVPKLQIHSDRAREDIQYMKDHALIGKFVGIWPANEGFDLVDKYNLETIGPL